MINRLLILSVFPIAIATSTVVIANKTIADQSVTPNNEQTTKERSPKPKGLPDLAKAAQKLGISEAKLKEALGGSFEPPPPPPPPPDIRGAAAKLNITEEKLIEALGLPPHPPGNCEPPTKQVPGQN